MKTKHTRQRRGFTLVELLVVITIIVALAGVSVPALARHLKTRDRLVATSHARDLGLCLNEFAMEYSSLPDRQTAAAVAERTGATGNLAGDTANDYFRQVIVAGFAKTETPFWAPTPQTKRRPDDLFEGGDALRPGEVAFAYLLNGSEAMPTDVPGRVIAITPVSNPAKGECDPTVFLDKAVALMADGSVQHLDIRPATRKVHLANGKTLLETGPGTRWGRDIHPVIKPPRYR
ncbi:MAG: type II secretion system GspH family protein [Akkermansiaceae bacterium]|jgi:prepilin-type N-terminal cleavage/methylation domain-containing protein|nr:type II secretion system GspH family protein [Akkermansiaceae bacterium]